MFHLQQLSQTSLSDSQLSKDTRYESLKAQVFKPDALKRLSASQVVASCVALGRLCGREKKEWSTLTNALKGFCDSESSRISSSQLCGSLYWLAKTDNALCVRERVLVSIYKHLLRESNSWTPVDMGWLLFFMNHKHEVNHPIWSKVLNQLAYRFNERLTHMSVKNIACILHEFSRLELIPAMAIHRALRYSDKRLSEMDPKTSTILLLSLAKLGVYRTDFIHSMADAIAGRLLSRFDMRQISQTLYALAKLDTFHSSLIQGAVNRFVSEASDKVSDADLAMVAYSLGRLGVVANQESWKRIQSLTIERRFDLSPLNICVVVLAIAKSGAKLDDGFLSHVSEMITANQRAFTPRQMTNLRYACSLLGGPALGGDFSVNGLDDKAVFQINVSRVTHCRDADKDFPIMKSLFQSKIHSNLKDFLILNGHAEVGICQQVGSVWVDALLADNCAVLLVGDSDMCKLSRKDLLGPLQWRIRYLEKLGFRVTTLHRLSAESVSRLWSTPEIGHLIRAPVPNTLTKRWKSPIHLDRDSGKISFRY